MQYDWEINGNNTAIVRFKDRITVYQLQKFKETFDEIRTKIGDRKRLILDFESLEYIDALALGIIVAYSKSFREKGGDIKIANMNEDLKLIFDLSRLSKVYEVYDSIQEADKHFA